MMTYKKPLGSLTEAEIKALIQEHNSGKDIDYDVKHLYGELLFRDMMDKWNEDGDEIEEHERRKDQGCGHDQNEGYYGKED